MCASERQGETRQEGWPRSARAKQSKYCLVRDGWHRVPPSGKDEKTIKTTQQRRWGHVSASTLHVPGLGNSRMVWGRCVASGGKPAALGLGDLSSEWVHTRGGWGDTRKKPKRRGWKRWMSKSMTGWTVGFPGSVHVCHMARSKDGKALFCYVFGRNQ